MYVYIYDLCLRYAYDWHTYLNQVYLWTYKKRCFCDIWFNGSFAMHEKVVIYYVSSYIVSIYLCVHVGDVYLICDLKFIYI